MRTRKGVACLILVILSAITFISFVSAGFVLGNKSHEITQDYAKGEAVKGWINISFENELADSLLSAFNSNVSLKKFLDDNSASYSCFPGDCESAYSASNAGNSKEFSLLYMKSRIFGVNLTGQVTEISQLSFDVQTTAGQNCFLNPVRIDVLDDGSVEWKADAVSENPMCYVESPYGCYNEQDSTKQAQITQDSVYCEKIMVQGGRGFQIGADVIKKSGTGNAIFRMSVNAGGYEGYCSSGESSGKIICNAILEGDIGEAEADVCIEVEALNGNTYEIKYEEINPCGYSGEYKYDFPIFIKPLKYEAVSGFSFNSKLLGDENIEENIFAYITDKYQGDCTRGCIIPINYYAGITQNVKISNLTLNYKASGLPESSSQMYDLEVTPPLINSMFQKLNLEKGNFLVPLSLGEKDFILKLNNEKILEEEINVRDVPKIKDIRPKEAPALVSYPFIVVLEEESGNLTYSWDFGDGVKQTTDTKSVKHSYSKIGNYNLTVTVSNSLGNSSKSVSIKVGSPKDYINSTIADYEEKLGRIKTEINKLPEWIKKEIEKKFDVDNLRSQINSQKTRYDAAFSDEDYVKIMESLIALNIPNSMNISQAIKPADIFPDPEQINLPALDYFGAGDVEGGERDYAEAVTNWFANSIQMNAESETYALYYDDRIEDLYSHVKIVLTARENAVFGETYFLVNGKPEEIKINTDKNVKEYDDALGMVFSDLESETIEFLYPEKIEIGKFPVYLSPEFRNLEMQARPGICNFNKKCEKNLGENYKNCRSDCKPVGWALLWIFILLFGALVVYVILQEWYKRYYESRLFPDKNQLFNLINFMNNSYNQGVRKSDIFDKLRDLDWGSEQLNYAWNKFQGKRTGMWEIPLFKWVENRQVKKELEKRGSFNVLGFRA